MGWFGENELCFGRGVVTSISLFIATAASVGRAKWMVLRGGGVAAGAPRVGRGSLAGLLSGSEFDSVIGCFENVPYQEGYTCRYVYVSNAIQ